MEAIERIAKTHNLKVIADAAHCFGTKINGVSIFNYGDLSTLSLHATKLMHSVEGGAIFVNDYSPKVEGLTEPVSPLRYTKSIEKLWPLGLKFLTALALTQTVKFMLL